MAKNRRKRRKKGKGGATSSAPGVYTDEVSSGAQPIEGVGTSIAAFVGTAGGAPPIPRRTHRLRKVVVLTVVAAGGVLAVQAWRRAQP